MKGDFGGLLKVFVDESLSLAENIFSHYLDLERLSALGEHDLESYNIIKSNLHTVKGNAGMMGLQTIQTLAHRLEDITVWFADHPTQFSSDAAESTLKGCGLLIDLIRSAEFSDGPDETSTATTIEDLDLCLKRLSERRRSKDRRSDTEWRTKSDRRRKPERRKEKPVETREDLAFGHISNTIRIDFRLLDQILETIGEGMIANAGLRMFRQRGANAHRETQGLEQVHLALDRIFKDLQSAMVKLRLLPVSTVFQRFPRLVHDLSRDLKKEVNLHIAGESTCLDKRIIDRIGEPLLHLVRNAMSHGIEAPDERVKLGKTRNGRIEMSACTESDRVVICVTDDGRGIDPDVVRQKALDKGIDTSEMGQNDVLRLIFTSGFSTASTVSEVAGRGVGLDVVAQAISDLNGTIEVISEITKGTRFRITLPLTITVVKSLIIEVDREQFAIPVSHIIDSVRIDPQNVHTVDGHDMVSWRDEVIHASDAGAVMGSTRAESAPRRFMVVVSSGGRKRAVLVDRLVSHQDLVVKGLRDTFGNLQTVSGATILGDGKIIFIVDVPKIVEHQLRSNHVHVA